MKRLLGLLSLLLKAVFFFTLFAFALNNQHEVVVHFFFGHQWTTNLVVLLLITLTLGVILGVLAMVPRWWRNRTPSAKETAAPASTSSAQSTASAQAASPGKEAVPNAPHTVVPPPDSIYGP